MGRLVRAIRIVGLAASMVLGVVLGLESEFTVRASLFTAAVCLNQVDYVYDISPDIWTSRESVAEALAKFGCVWFTPRGGFFRPSIEYGFVQLGPDVYTVARIYSDTPREIVVVHFADGREGAYVLTFDQHGRIISVE